MKKRPKKTADHAPGPVTHYTVGVGISREGRIGVNLQHPNCTPADVEAVIPKGNYTFEGRVAFAEKWAKKILEEAELPTDPGVIYTIPTGEPADTKTSLAPGNFRGSLLPLVEARGFRERESMEWYAAEILSELRLVRTLIERGETAQAAHRALDLGMLLRELYDVMLHNPKVLKWEGWQGSGGLGGSKEKKIRPLQKWVDETVKRYPNKAEGFFWGSLPAHEEGDSPELINGVEMIREDTTLVVKYPDGRSRTVARSTFPRYVARAKEKLKK